MPDDSRLFQVVENTEVTSPRPTSQAAIPRREGRLQLHENSRASDCAIWVPARDQLSGKADRSSRVRTGGVLIGYLKDILGENGMRPADAGMVESASEDVSPHRASDDWGLKMVYAAVLCLTALCTVLALSSYVSERLMVAKQQGRLDIAAKRFDWELHTAATGNPR